MESAKNRLLVALDVPDGPQAVELAGRLKPHVGGLKIGLELFCAEGPSIVHKIGGSGIFLDLKLHDIPNTVAAAIRRIAGLGVMMCNVHCLGGLEMMRAAAGAAADAGSAMQVLGVTVLTSLDAAALTQVKLPANPSQLVLDLARLAQDSGLHGVVCSPLETAAVRAACGPDFVIVTPGVRPAGADQGDQKRVLTPAEAVAQGADWIVVGRPITAATDPATAAAAIAGDALAAAGRRTEPRP